MFFGQSSKWNIWQMKLRLTDITTDNEEQSFITSAYSTVSDNTRINEVLRCGSKYELGCWRLHELLSCKHWLACTLWYYVIGLNQMKVWSLLEQPTSQRLWISMFTSVSLAVACANVSAYNAHLQMSRFTTLRVTAVFVSKKVWTAALWPFLMQWHRVVCQHSISILPTNWSSLLVLWSARDALTCRWLSPNQTSKDAQRSSTGI